MLSKKVAQEIANFHPKISLTNPLGDYVKLIEKKVRPIAMRREVFLEYWKKISSAARATIWKMIFNNRTNTLSVLNTEICSELLTMLKEDSGRFGATEYNKWIVDVRNELLRKNMLQFWYVIVHKELGPCCARDSDLFTDLNDPEVESFYNHADCVAPWLMEVKRIRLDQSSSSDDEDDDEEFEYIYDDDDDDEDAVEDDEHADEDADEDADEEDNGDDDEAAVSSSNVVSTEESKPVVTLRHISHENAVEDYKYNMEAVVHINSIDPDYLPVFEQVRETIWNILFTEPTLSAVNYKRAADLLLEYKKDAVYHNPWDYNDWIPAIRDELLRKKFFDFWKNVMVEQELGLCWARDCDYYDDMNDPEPVEFYKFANCEAAWLKE